MAPSAVIVDDHAGFRTVARRLLEGAGFEVVMEAPDGEAAVAAVRRLRPDLVLVDVGLPGMDGIEVAALLAAEHEPPVVVLTSGRDAADYGERLAASAAAGFVPKAELTASRIRAFLSSEGRAGAMPEAGARGAQMEAGAP